MKLTTVPDDDFFETEKINKVPVKLLLPSKYNLIIGRIYHPELEYMSAYETDCLLLDCKENYYSITKIPGKNYADIYYSIKHNRELPHSVLLGWDRVRVRPVQAKPVRCYCCQAYGHKAAACTKTPVCPTCSGDHEPTRQCQQEKKCPACSGPHSAFHPECPVWLEEKEVVKIKKKEQLSYRDAVKKRQEQKKEQSRTREQEEDPTEEQEPEEEQPEEQEQDEQEDTDEEEVNVEDTDQESNRQAETNKRKSTDEQEDQEQEQDKTDKANDKSGSKSDLPGGWRKVASRKKKK